MPSKGLADVFSTHSLNLQHKILDFSSLNELPDSHAWTPRGLDHYPTYGGGTCDPEAVSVIDQHDENATELIGHACKRWGVFQVINHHISKNLIDEVEMEGKRLFSLPMYQKLKAARLPNGVSGYGVVLAQAMSTTDPAFLTRSLETSTDWTMSRYYYLASGRYSSSSR